MTKKVLIWLFRFLFIGLIIFEFLNLIKFFHFPLDFSWLGLIITSSLVLLAAELLIRLLKIREYLGIVLGLSFLIIALDAGGDIFRLYSRIAFYDRFLHFIGGAVIAYLAFIMTKKFFINFPCLVPYDPAKRDSTRLGGFFHSIFAIGTANIMGVFYEIEEYLEDVFVHHRQLRLGDGPDGADDLLMNLVGATVAILAVFLIEKIKNKFQNRENKNERKII